MTNKPTLSLKLPPEVAKIMPWIISAKKSGHDSQAAWAKREYEVASQNALWRLQREERMRAYEIEHKEQEELRRKQDALWASYDRAIREEDERVRRESARWARFGFPRALEEGFDEPQPSHSSQKGWRRNLSELPRRGLGLFFADWGMLRQAHRDKKRNRGQKPRKPWFKKQRARH